MKENHRPAGRNAPPRRADRFAQREEAEEVEGQLEGRNAISEALKSGRTIDKVFVADGDTDKGLQRLAANNFKFTESDRTRENREAVKRDNNNIFDFLQFNH